MAHDDLRGIAFNAWYECGASLTRTLAKLTALGYVITRQTLANWRDEGEWQNRAHRLDSEKQAAQDALYLTEDEQLLAGLKRQQDKYEIYFETLEKPDTQATYAYSGLIKTIQEVAQRTNGYKRAIFTEYFKDALSFFREHKPNLAAMLEEEANSYLAHIRENI